MTALIDVIHEQIKQSTRDGSVPSWLADFRAKAFSIYENQTLPTKRDEAYRYSPISRLLTSAVDLSAFAASEKSELPQMPEAQISCVFDAGTVMLSSDANKSKDIICCPLSVAIQNDYFDAQTYFNERLASSRNALEALHLALVQEGIFLKLPEGCRLEAPISLLYQGLTSTPAYYEHIIELDANSELEVIESSGQSMHPSFLSTRMGVHIANNAQFKLFHCEPNMHQDVHHMSHHIQLEKDAQCNIEHFLLGGTLNRTDICVDLLQPGASCHMNGLFIAQKDECQEIHTTFNHKASHTKSDQFIKGILDGRAKGVFDGCVAVSEDIAHVSSSQQNKNLLLSSDADMSTKPELKIFSDDVKCAHGATIGQLDETALFYLRSRGISEVTARALLIEAFIQDRVQQIKNPSLKAWMESVLRYSFKALA